MTLRYGFYNSQNHDRVYNADDMNDFLDGIISEGIIRGYKGELRPQLMGKNQVRVFPGKAWILKTWNILDDLYTMPLDAADPTKNRYDLLVIHVDRTARTNDIRIIPGTPGKPYDLSVLKNTSTVKDYLLAIVNVTAGNNNNILYDWRERSGYSIAARGLNEPISLGSEVTLEQANAILTGDFTMFPLGSYWIDEDDEVGVVRWRIVHHDYINNALVLLPSKALWHGNKGTVDRDGMLYFLKHRTTPPPMFAEYAYTFELKYISHMEKQNVVVDNAYYPVTKTFSDVTTCFKFPSATALGSTAYIGCVYTSADRNYLDYDRLTYCWEHPEVLILENLPSYYGGDEGIVYLNEYVNSLDKNGGNYVSSYYRTDDSIKFGTSSLENSKIYVLPYIVIHG